MRVALGPVSKALAGTGLALLWSNRVLPGLGLDQRGRTAANACFATGYGLAFGGRSHWRSGRGLAVGASAGAVVLAGYGAAVAIPALREMLRDFAPVGQEVSDIEWVAVHIPVGTVYSEELIFRSTLEPLLDDTFGPRLGPLLGAAAFGLWHIHPARAGGEPVGPTVLATAAGGAILGRLRRKTGSTTAPALLHWAINAGGVLATRLALPEPIP
ncbi:CPBP family intramembrane glutamic endopeptidase [Nocardia lijiangensis]|uniref:CPBP family intramembrane glutamic endopeptidase n=1 Tax=Nocardia lijiangensis TaxID=299618 RepID=UPI0009FC0327|nr:CPBP family intramembrane glutamic endopeptidase [Nocardia lijiangensis]